MAGLAKQGGGRAVSYLSVRRGRPPAFYESGHGTTKRYTHTEASWDLSRQFNRQCSSAMGLGALRVARRCARRLLFII